MSLVFWGHFGMAGCYGWSVGANSNPSEFTSVAVKVLVPKIVVKMSALPSGEDLEVLLREFCPLVDDDGSFLSHGGAPTLHYMLLVTHFISSACEANDKHYEATKIPLFTVPVERGLSYLFYVVLLLLLDHSWTEDEVWRDHITNQIVPRLVAISNSPRTCHVFASSLSSWFQVLISLSLHHEIRSSRQSQLEVSEEFDPLSFRPEQRELDFQSLLDREVRQRSVQVSFETLLESLNGESASPSSATITPEIAKMLRARCGTLLSLQLLRKGGIEAASYYFINCRSESVNQTVEMCCHVICKKPIGVSLSEWFHLYAVQLIPFFEMDEQRRAACTDSVDPDGLFPKVVWAVTSKLTEMHPLLAEQHILRVLLEPFYFWQGLLPLVYGTLSQDDDEEVIVEEKEMSKCIETVWRLFVLAHPSSALYSCLAPIFPALFHLHCFLNSSALHQRSRVKETVLTFIESSSEAGGLLKAIIMPPQRFSEPFWARSSLKYGAGSSGGVLLKRQSSVSVFDASRQAECIVSLLKECKDSSLPGDLFVDLMHEMMAIPEEERDERYLNLLQYLVQMLEEFGESVLKDIVQVCMFLQAALASKDEHTLSISLAIIAALLSGSIKLKEEEVVLIYELESSLERVELSNPSLSELASDLRAKILVNDKASWVFQPNTIPKEGSNSSSHKEETLEQILNHLSDPLLPVRGHGVVALRQLVLAKNKEADANREKILSIFRHQLDDDDL